MLKIKTFIKAVKNTVFFIFSIYKNENFNILLYISLNNWSFGCIRVKLNSLKPLNQDNNNNMRKTLLLMLCGILLQACSTKDEVSTSLPTEKIDAKKDNKNIIQPDKKWNGSSLSNQTIASIQEKKSIYKQCVYKEAQKQGYQKIDARVATDAVIKQCEQQLSHMRGIFINQGVPDIIADRFLKKTRTDMTRKILKSLMFAAAARHAGAN